MATAFLHAGNVKKLGHIRGQVDKPGSGQVAFPDAVDNAVRMRKLVLCVPEGDIPPFGFHARSISAGDDPDGGTLWTCIIELFSGDSHFQSMNPDSIPVIYLKGDGTAELHCEDRVITEVVKTNDKGVVLRFQGGETRQFHPIDGAYAGKVFTLRRTVDGRLIIMQGA